MANKEHLAILKQGVEVWNKWRQENPEIKPNLSKASLRRVYLGKANFREASLKRTDLRDAHASFADFRGAILREALLSGAILSGANLSDMDLRGMQLEATDLKVAKLKRANLSGVDLNLGSLVLADLSEADLSNANLFGVNLNQANLARANLTRANLSWTNLGEAILYGAILNEATLTGAQLVEANFEHANLTGCRIYGISAWNVKLEGTIQTNLIITQDDEPTITVDNLEVAQFIYLLLRNEKIRDIIDTIATKVILILGRFMPERKAVLDAIKDELRKHNYLPVLFDFDKPLTRDFTETVRTLAHLSRFIIADLTDPSSIPQELQAIVPDLAVPIKPILLMSKREYSMFIDFQKKYDWVLPVHHYDDIPDLLASLGTKVIAPAEAKAKELEKR